MRIRERLKSDFKILRTIFTRLKTSLMITIIVFAPSSLASQLQRFKPDEVGDRATYFLELELLSAFLMPFLLRSS